MLNGLGQIAGRGAVGVAVGGRLGGSRGTAEQAVVDLDISLAADQNVWMLLL